jgi:hypothetical protein
MGILSFGFTNYIPACTYHHQYDKSKTMKWAGHVTRMGEEMNAYRILVGKPEGQRPLARPTRKWEDNIRIDPREIGWSGMDWIDLAQNRGQWRALVNTVMILWVP